MADTQAFVLVPEAAEAALKPLVTDTVRMHTYNYIDTTRLARILRRAGLLDDAQVLDRTFRAASSTPWEMISALWLGADVQMTRGAACVLLERMPALKQVFWQRTGLDGLPTHEFEARGIRVINAGSISSRWVAESIVACIAADAKFLTLAARNRVPALTRFTRGFEGLRVTVIGTGRIGREVAQLSTALGMRVIGISRDPSRSDPGRASFTELRRFPEDIESSARETDYLVLALPAADGTYGLIDERILRALGPSGVLVNLARPGIVDQTALYSALREGALHAAYVSRLESSGWRFWRQRLPSNLFLTFNREAHVAEKLTLSASRFAKLVAPWSTATL